MGDNADAFPGDPTETTDTDGDGVGDNADAFPKDPNESIDNDNDGLGDNTDVCDNSPVGQIVDESGCSVEPSAGILSPFRVVIILVAISVLAIALYTTNARRKV